MCYKTYATLLRIYTFYSYVGSMQVLLTENAQFTNLCSGHRIGTAEVESALVSHPQCAEAAVVGVEHEVCDVELRR